MPGPLTLFTFTLAAIPTPCSAYPYMEDRSLRVYTFHRPPQTQAVSWRAEFEDWSDDGFATLVETSFTSAPHARPSHIAGCADLTIDPQIPTTEPIIMLLDRGGCRFSQKVLNAQRAGAVGALVVDNMGLCGVSPECSADICSRCPLSTSNPQCQCVLPYMSGDGSSAGDVSIPSFMVPREAGNSMKPLAGPGPVGKAYATMSWDMPNPG